MYTMAWGRHPADRSGQHTLTITTAAHADEALDSIAAQATTDECPRMVDLYEGTWQPGQTAPATGMQLVWGHPERASLTWLGPGAGYAIDPAVPPWPQPIEYDQDEIGSHRTRLTPATVRRAVQEYLQTGQRPTGLQWTPA